MGKFFLTIIQNIEAVREKIHDLTILKFKHKLYITKISISNVKRQMTNLKTRFPTYLTGKGQYS